MTRGIAPSSCALQPDAPRLIWATVFGVLLIGGPWASAATISHSTNFSFNHTGSVSTGFLSILTIYSNTEAHLSGSLSLPRFDPGLGTLTGVAVTVTTTTNTMTVQKTVSFNPVLLGSASASRTLAYTVTAGTAAGGGSDNATTSGGTLLNLLGNPTASIGGAALNHTTSFSNAGDLAQFTGLSPFSVNLTATNIFSITTALSLFNAGFSGTGTYAGTVTVVYTYTPITVEVGGHVYRDDNRNGFRDVHEQGTGLSLYAKLLSNNTPAGPALQAVPVNATTGAYAFTQVTPGTYRIVLSANASLADVAPVPIPSGWSMTEHESRIRPDVAVGVTKVSNLNFGYTPFSRLSGRVFRDTGAGGGIPNDGVRNGGETGLGGVTLRLLDGSDTVLDSTQTDADGSYRLHLASALPHGTTLRVAQVVPHGMVATGGSGGSTGGSYHLPASTVTFPHAAGANYSGVDFGNVPLPVLTAEGRQSALPGSVVFYTHQFISGTSGTVVFEASGSGDPFVEGWTETVHIDDNGNGYVDTNEPPLDAPIPVAEGQVLNLVVRVFVPVAAPRGARHHVRLEAQFAFTGAAPPPPITLARTNVTTVGANDAAGLKLIKHASKAAAKPGDTLEYTLSFSNHGAKPLQNISLHDVTPAFTRFAAASIGALPSGLALGELQAPPVGQQGALQWSFSGDLQPGASGTVTFSVTVDH